MCENIYIVYDVRTRMEQARTNSIDTAIIILKALMNEWYLEPNLELSIKRIVDGEEELIEE